MTQATPFWSLGEASFQRTRSWLHTGHVFRQAYIPHLSHSHLRLLLVFSVPILVWSGQMRQLNKIDLLERRFEEYVTVSKRAAFTLLDAVIYLAGLYTMIKTIFHLESH